MQFFLVISDGSHLYITIININKRASNSKRAKTLSAQTQDQNPRISVREAIIPGDTTTGENHNLVMSYEEFKEQLNTIELQTKQTNVDLEQLFDRLKNNNQNLNKLLESIADYSREVTTEGNATKNDATRILGKLKVLPEGNLEGIIQTHLESLKLDIIKQITDVIQNENRIESSCKKILIDGQLTEIKSGLNKLSSHLDSPSPSNESLQTDVREITRLSEKTIAELSVIKSLFEKQKDHNPINIESLADSLNSLTLSLSQPERINLQKLIENQTILIESLKESVARSNVAQATKDDIDALNQKYTHLQRKYDVLTLAYEEKYKAFLKLDQNFQHLEQKFNLIVNKVESRDFKKYEKLQKLHVSKMSEYANPPSFSVKKKRIISMPNRQYESPIRENNSDDSSNEY